MSKLVTILKATGISASTGLAAYYGFEMGENLTSYLPRSYMIPEITKGFSAFMVGSIGNHISRKFLGRKRIGESEAYSIVALNAFANTHNDNRNLSIEDSLKSISDNLVEVIIENGNKTHLGSGLMITSDGYVITAHHVIKEMIESQGKAQIKMQNGKRYLIAKKDLHYNANTDLAIIKAKKLSYYAEPIKVKVDLSSKLNFSRSFGFLIFALIVINLLPYLVKLILWLLSLVI